MTSGEIVITVFMGFVSAGLGALFWARLNRLEDRIDALSDKVGEMVTRDEFREEMARVRSEFWAEISSLRSDLTQIALAVGARRPQASEG